MPNGHGGYRAPQHPAPASGPGRLARRTDGGPGQKLRAATGQAYGDHKAQIDAQRAAPLALAPQANAPKVQVPSAGGQQAQAPQLPPFGGPTARPNEPITHGVDIGPGGGSEVLPLTAQPQFQSQGPMTQMLSGLAASDSSGVLANLYHSALSLGA